MPTLRSGIHLPHRLNSGCLNTLGNAGLSGAEHSNVHVFAQKANSRLSNSFANGPRNKFNHLASYLKSESNASLKYSDNHLHKKTENIRINIYESLRKSDSSDLFKEILNIRKLAVNKDGPLELDTLRIIVNQTAKDILQIDRNTIKFIPSSDEFKEELKKYSSREGLDNFSSKKVRHGFKQRISNWTAWGTKTQIQTKAYNKSQPWDQKTKQYWDENQTPFQPMKHQQHEQPTYQRTVEGNCEQIFDELVLALEKASKTKQYWDVNQTPYEPLAEQRYKELMPPGDQEQ